MRRVQVIAHRGASAYAPENTIAAFDLALQQGADAIETDIRCTRDGIPVLCHDATVERVSNGKGEVAALTLEELNSLDFGHWFSPQFSGQTIVTLHTFLERYGGRCPLVLELKQAGIHATVGQLVANMRLLSSVIFTSFELSWLINLRERWPQAHMGFLVRVFDEGTIENVSRARFDQICPHAATLTQEVMDKAQTMGLAVRAWGVSNEELQERALQMGVDGMTVNWPDRLINRLITLGWR